MLEIKNLTKVYEGGTQALTDVSFSVKPGEFLAVIGLSGSGKSTLLRCINRLIEPTEGQIIWNGQDVTAASQDEMLKIRRKIGMIFQHFNLVPVESDHQCSGRTFGICKSCYEFDEPLPEKRS